MDLYEACENGNEERVVELLIYGEHWFHAFRERTGSSAHSTGKSTGLDSITTTATTLASVAAESAGMLTSPTALLHARGTAGRTPLHAACMAGQLGVVRLLVGATCEVFFTSRCELETQHLLAPLVQAFMLMDAETKAAAPRDLFEVTLVSLDGDTSSEVVPRAMVQLDPTRTIATRELLDGTTHVDDFGNTPLQCVSCFGCGSSEQHLENGLEITKWLLLRGDQPNLAKFASQWTPLHWSAYHGNHEQAAILLNPAKCIENPRGHRFGRTQRSIPLLVNADNLFAVDIAGRSGLSRLNKTHRRGNPDSVDEDTWLARLNHVDVIRLMAREFLDGAGALGSYVREMNDRIPVHLQSRERKKKRRKKELMRSGFTTTEAIRYGQHVLYWAGCFGLVNEVRELLYMPMSVAYSTGNEQHQDSEELFLLPLYVCSCEENKRQSALHAAASYGQHDVVALLLSKILYDQQRGSPVNTAMIARSTSLMRRHRPSVVPTTSDQDDVPTTATTKIKKRQSQLLDVDTYLSAGWTNDRCETALFLAVLHLQLRVVITFCKMLSPSSLQWELANCNVEGSYIYHVTNEATRKVLGLTHHQSLTDAEYVLLFDGVAKKQFKETVLETMREDSAMALSLIAKRVGHRIIPASWKSMYRAKQVDYVVVGASENVLVRHAQALELKVKHRGSSVRSKYDAALAFCFEPFRSLQRQQVVFDLIRKKLHVHKHLASGNLMAVFPLHDTSGCKNIIRQWVQSDEGMSIFQPLPPSSLRQFLLERQTHHYEMLWPLLTYFGEKHTFYYAFMLFYTSALLLVAVPGGICQLLWSIGRFYYLSPIFAVLVSLWATLVVEGWKRKKSEIQRNFGNFKRNRNEQTADFYGDFEIESLKSTAINVTFPKTLQVARIYLGLPLLLTMATAVVMIFIGVKMSSTYKMLVRNALPWLPQTLAENVIPVLNAISMLVLDNLYTKLALALTRWENHRTVWEYESMLATKLFWFKFLNAFISLFWVAFVEHDAARLRNQLLIVMGVRQLWYTFIRSIFPLFCVRRRWKEAGFVFQKRASYMTIMREWYTAELPPEPHPMHASVPPIVLLQELMVAPDFLLNKQMEIVLQFGYVTMFVSVLPMAPLLAVFSNVVNMRLDIICCTQAKQRPRFESETEVSTFMNILEFMSFAAVAVNSAVLFFTTKDDFDSLLKLMVSSETMNDAAMYYLMKLWVLVVLEHIVLGAKALLSLTIEDSAAWVQNEEDQDDDTIGALRNEEETRATVARASMSSPVPGFTSELVTSGRVPDGSERMIDDLLAEVSDWKAISPNRGMAFNILIAQKYAAAVRERDDALQREKDTERKLLECSRRLQEQSLGSARSEPTGDRVRSLEELPTSYDDLVAAVSSETNSSRCCVLCWALRDLDHWPQKRCLSCKVFLCADCDALLHLDDLGVTEPTHYRVSMPSEALFSPVQNTEQLYSSVTIAVEAEANAMGNTNANMAAELRHCIHECISMGTAQEELHAHQPWERMNIIIASSLSPDTVFQRSWHHIGIVLRYLHNARRQVDHQRQKSITPPLEPLVVHATS